ncbi:hypothetical protein BOTCAL_0608g00050 [Botryotinia calthae]|uniref:Heterokaryon incompatibility domain-containing protein n=1 Tax=Botryotinia calthae TaxID=38488 RepID=A0A4Y8CIT6_9HELO|nr:hypothetical protein BOTCAL_0608g00050 [Botryotinia calthae]
MSLAENRSVIDGDDDGIVDLRELGLELGATESDAMESLSSDAVEVEVGGVRQAQERGNTEILVEGNDKEGNENLEIDGASTNNSALYPDQDYGIESDTDGLREESSLENEGHESIKTHALEDSDNHHVNDDRDMDVDEQDDGVSLVERKERGEEESSELISAYEMGFPYYFRWPIEDPQITNEKLKSKNETNTATAEILNPNLCKFCRVFFDTWSSVCDFFLKSHSYRVLVSAHHDTMSGLKASASGGCHLCALFLSILHIRYCAHGSGNQLLLDQFEPYRIQISNTKPYRHERREEIGNNCRISLKFWSIENDIRIPKAADATMIPDEVLDFEHWKRQFYIDTHLGQKDFNELRLGSTEKSAALAQAWLQECSSTHSACRQGEEASVLPTRLIKIDCQEIRLCVSADENCSRYATLSHCWGKEEVLRLQKDNYHAFLKKITYDKLCKTFRDAIDIARVLGFSWLWIDSLCIILGDSEDWSKEASRMATVYGLSSLNIAATAAPDGTIGCLFERDLKYTETYKAEVKINHQKQVYKIADYNLYRQNIAKAALTRRAWAVQERILAPRTLHFTESQLFWECRTKRACETFADTLPEALCNYSLYLPKQELQDWGKIVAIYTRGLLTNESDLLIAIGGVARQLQKKNGDKYLAGLWQARIKEQMCWWKNGYNWRHSGENTWSAPSWSWAAVNQKVFLPHDTTVIHESYIHVTKVDIALENVDDPFGGVKSGTLELRSKFMILCERKPFENFISPSVGNFGLDNDYISWDHEYDERSSRSSEESCYDLILMLPVGLLENTRPQSDFSRIEGLLLAHADQENGQYERLGHFTILERESEYGLIRRAMNLAQDEQFRELGLGNALPLKEDYISTDIDEDGLTWYKISIV